MTNARKRLFISEIDYIRHHAEKHKAWELEAALCAAKSAAQRLYLKVNPATRRKRGCGALPSLWGLPPRARR